MFVLLAKREGAKAVDWQKVSGRLLNWGTPLLVAGALLCFFARMLTSRLPEERQEKVSIALKFAGLALALLGAMAVLEFI